MTKEAESSFSFDSLEDVHEGIQESSPMPNEPAIEAHGEKVVAEQEYTGSLVDSDGNKFDPALHAVNKDGEPSVTPTGKFRKKRGASKVATQTEQQLDAQKKAEARAAGFLAADMLINSSVMLLGPEWVPIGSKELSADAQINEHEMLRRAFGDYFEAKGIADFPPGIALTVALSAYAMPRVAAGEETKTRLAKLKIWTAEKWNKLKRKRKDAAQSDSRDNGKRKDNASEKAMQHESPKATRNPRT